MDTYHVMTLDHGGGDFIFLNCISIFLINSSNFNLNISIHCPFYVTWENLLWHFRYCALRDEEEKARNEKKMTGELDVILI